MKLKLTSFISEPFPLKFDSGDPGKQLLLKKTKTKKQASWTFSISQDAMPYCSSAWPSWLETAILPKHFLVPSTFKEPRGNLVLFEFSGKTPIDLNNVKISPWERFSPSREIEAVTDIEMRLPEIQNKKLSSHQTELEISLQVLLKFI